MAIFFAMITAIAFGFDNYFVRKGLLETPHPMVPTFVTLTINFSFFIILSLIFVPISLLKLNLVYLFIIAGILAPGLARAFSYKGLETLGMSISAPIINAELLFTVLMALIFLNEQVSFSIVIGILGVVTGLVLLGYETGQGGKIDISKRIHYRYLFYPITASIFYGVSVFFRKLGLNSVSSPILGAMVTSGTAWFIVSVFLMTGENLKRLCEVKKQSLIHFALGGGATCIGWFSFFHALNIGKVVIVTPIANTYSLVTLLLSYTLLRKVERISLKIVIATILIVGGIILLSVGK